MSNKKAKAAKSDSYIEIRKVWIPVTGAVIVALITGVFGMLQNPTIWATLFPSPTPVPPTISSYDQALTQVAINTEQADFLNTAIAAATQSANLTATKSYISAYQTAQVNIESTRIFEQAEQDLATQQAMNAEKTAQSVVSTQQALATTSPSEKSKSEKAILLFNTASTIDPVLIDLFNGDDNGWSPTKGKTIETSIQDGVFKADIFANAKVPFLWTCDHCGPFRNFSYQIDVLTPYDIHGVVAGIYFGSPTRIDKDAINYLYAVTLNSSGVISLEWLSTSKRDLIKRWTVESDIISPDGKFRNLQVIVQDNFITIFVDGKMIGEVDNLNYTGAGYIGLDIHTADVRIEYDNLRVINMP